MLRNILVTSAALFLLLLGMYGQYQLSPENLTERFTTSLYEVTLLFILAGEWTTELPRVPLALEVVRFVAPLATFTSIIAVLATNTRISLTNYLVRFYSGHMVVVGLGERSWQFLRTCKDKSLIVVVERDPENLLIHRARDIGVKVIVGDIFEDEMFHRINLGGVTSLIAFTGSDGTNIELAVKARSYSQGGEKTRLRIHIHVNEVALAHQLEGYPKFNAEHSITEISFFSVYDLSARLMLRDYPPEIFADVAGQKLVHLAIYGFGRLAEKLVIEAALLCQYANGRQLKFTIFDDDACGKELKLKSEYPCLADICDYQFVQQDYFGPHVFTNGMENALPLITQHIICKETDEENLSTALMLRTILLSKRSSNAPILVRMQQSSGLAQLLESNTGGAEIPDGLYPFGMLDEVLHRDNILADQLDKVARCMHEMYLQAQTDDDHRTHSALQAWNELPQWERKQNMLKADHWPVRLRAIHCIADNSPNDAPVLSSVEAQVQATMEHNRYVTQKKYDGWQYGEKRVEEAKINPFLVPWSELPNQQREQEVSEAQAEPRFIARESQLFTRRVMTIGVSGHRLDRVNVNDENLRRAITRTLRGFADEYPDHHFVILSPLAEGADRLVAELAMRELNASLHVPLPLPYDLYTADFSTRESVREFQCLVGQASFYYEMPMKFGSVRELALGHDRTGNEARDKQYALAGAYIIQRCDRLIAIYDGQPEAGIGGTGQILRWYEQGGIDAEFLYSNEFFLPSQKKQAVIIHPQQNP